VEALRERAKSMRDVCVEFVTDPAKAVVGIRHESLSGPWGR
jgi:hypothetical protein